MKTYQSQIIEGESLVVGFVSNDEEHFKSFKEVNKHHVAILVNESVSLIGLEFNILIFTEDSSTFDKDFIKALNLRTVKKD